MNVTKRTPEPTTPPPVYDITNLTLDQVIILRDILGKFSAGKTTEMYQMLYDIAPLGIKYRVDTVGYVLHLTEMG